MSRILPPHQTPTDTSTMFLATTTTDTQWPDATDQENYEPIASWTPVNNYSPTGFVDPNVVQWQTQAAASAIDPDAFRFRSRQVPMHDPYMDQAQMHYPTPGPLLQDTAQLGFTPGVGTSPSYADTYHQQQCHPSTTGMYGSQQFDYLPAPTVAEQGWQGAWGPPQNMIDPSDRAAISASFDLQGLAFPSNTKLWGGPVYRQQPPSHAEAASHNHMHCYPASGSGFTTPTTSAGPSASSTPAPPAFAQLPVTALRVHEEKAAGRKQNRNARRVAPTTSAAPKRKCASAGTLSNGEIKSWVEDAQADSGYFTNTVSCQWKNCGMEFTLAQIRNHLRETHDVDTEPAPCQWAGCTLTAAISPGSMVKHLRSNMHLNTKLTCATCNKDFARSDALARHLRGSL